MVFFFGKKKDEKKAKVLKMALDDDIDIKKHNNIDNSVTEKIRNNYIAQALSLVEILSGSNLSASLVWKWKLGLTPAKEREKPPMVLVNHLVLSSKFWDMLDEGNRWMWMEYVSFMNNIFKKPLHLVEEAGGFVVLKWVYEGLFVYFKYGFVPIPYLQSDTSGFKPIPPSEYVGAFYISGSNVPMMVAYLGSIYEHMISMGYNADITKLVRPNMPDSVNIEYRYIWEMEKQLEYLEKTVMAPPIKVKLRVPEEITKFSLKRTLHIIESSRVWVPLK